MHGTGQITAEMSYRSPRNWADISINELMMKNMHIFLTCPTNCAVAGDKSEPGRCFLSLPQLTEHTLAVAPSSYKMAHSSMHRLTVYVIPADITLLHLRFSILIGFESEVSKYI